MQVLLVLIFLCTSSVSIAQAMRNDIVIDEIMADPSPPVLLNGGLPEVEYIELKNVSAKAINLNGWKLSDATGTATITANFTLQPDSFVIVCSTSAAAVLSGFGATLGVANFPSIDNDGEMIYLRSKEGRLIHGLQFEKSWYKNAVKSDGGWSLEMTDTRNACSGYSNWKSSLHTQGGTPGKRNSVDALNADALGPTVMRSYATDSLNIVVLFDEPLDSTKATATGGFSISDDVGNPASASPIAPLFTSVVLHLKIPLKKEKVYTVSVKDITDCSGNTILGANLTKLGLASSPDSFDIVINEALFNPRPDGTDYVEIYNRSNKIIDMKDLFFASRSITGTLSTLKQLSPAQHLIFPQDFLAITENAAIVKQQYVSRNPAGFIEISMPSLPDERGTIVLLGRSGKIIDELTYDEKWHFQLLDNKEGVALERIDYNEPTQNAQNWHSAATDAGYGTPAGNNSQFRANGQPDGIINMSPAVFSPDNDGFNDFLTVNYRFPEPGYSCNIIVYDANGRVIRFLCKNALCGTKGYFQWDGLDEKSYRLPTGIYVLFTEIFNLAGKVKKFKNAVVLARRF